MENDTIYRTEELIHFLDRKVRSLKEKDPENQSRIDKWMLKRNQVEEKLEEQINQFINQK